MFSTFILQTITNQTLDLMRIPFSFLIFLVAYQFGHSQVTIDPEPSWIVTETYNPSVEIPTNDINGGAYLLLYTEQVNSVLEESYVKSVAKAVAYSGIQNISTVVADYDPTYQKLRFHNVEVIRNGIVINKLSFQEIQTARRETNAENFIYDGTISAFINIPDVRIDDIVLYSYSIKGFNPIQKGKFSSSFTLNSSEAIDKLSVHIFSAKELKYQVLNSDLDTKHSLNNGIHHYEWSLEKIPAMVLEDFTPTWYIQNAMVLVTEYTNWNEVISWGQDIFTFNEPLNKELQTIVAQIKNSSRNEGERIKAALSFVQNEIRYLAVHSGIGGYKPNAPNKVMLQRFGDCKDKSVLLTAMLKALEIDAYPTLVNTSLRQELLTLQPSSKVFDHCIVKVIDKNKSVRWYDPTLTDQGGTYDNIYTPDYRFGLVLDKNLSTLDTISDFTSNMVEAFSTFKLKTMGKGAELEVRTHYYDGEADYMRSIFRNNSKDIIEKELLKFYAETYGPVAVIDSPVFVDDSIKNEFALLERYQLDSIWRPSVENTNKLNLSIYPTNITNALSMPNQLQRITPIALSYPMARKHNINVIFPETISIQPESYTLNSDFFYYDFNSKYDKSANILSLDYYYKNQNDHVSASRYNEYYGEMGKLDQKIGYLIMINKTGQPINNNFAYTLGKLFGYGFAALFFVVLLVVIIIFLVRKKTN